MSPPPEADGALWQLDTWRDPDRRVVAVVVWPIADAFTHDVDPQSGPDCPCGPALELLAPDGGPDRWMVTHHALDGRQ